MYDTVRDTIDSINHLGCECDRLNTYLLGNHFPTKIVFYDDEGVRSFTPAESTMRKVVEVILHDYVDRITDMKDELRRLLLDTADDIVDELYPEPDAEPQPSSTSTQPKTEA